MNRPLVGVVVGSLVGATIINALIASCGSVSTKTADARSVDTPTPDTPANGAMEAPSGTIVAFAGQAVPQGWLVCDGSEASRTQYASLFAVIGTVYGQGDQITSFNLPDLRGRTVVGVGQGAGLTLRDLAAKGGEETHTLTIAEMPSHTHQEKGSNRLDGANGGGIHYQDVDNATFQPITSGATGGGQAHNTMPPFVSLNYIIKV